MAVLHFHVHASRGAAGESRVAVFDASGGTIGRAVTNTLVLDDPERTVSRVHAQVLCRDGQFFVIDRGSNPLLVNGRALGAGNETPLAPDDRLVIGGFELKVELPADTARAASGQAAAQSAPGDDPFADLLAGLAPPWAAPAAAPTRAPAAAAPTDLTLFPDPMGSSAPGRGQAAMDPFADLLGAVPAPAATAGLGSLDDFSDLGAAQGSGKANGIDDLFGGMGGLGAGSDPLALSPLADPLLQPNTAADADPLAALQGANRAGAAPRSDHLPVGQFGYTPPRAVAPVMPPAPPHAPTTPATAPMAFDDETGFPIPAPVSPLVDPFADLMSDLGPPSSSPSPAVPVVPVLPVVPVAVSPVAPLAPVPSMPPTAAPVAVVAPSPGPPSPSPAPVAPRAGAPAVPSAPPATSTTASDAELLAALLRGLGNPHQAPETLTPGLMERIGVILRASTEGTLQLLLTRQEFKREVRAEVTMIASQANNPLKFSPTVEVALAHLLGPGVRGFMPPEAAMKDAYNDLRSHQFGVMVGMRAALAHVIERFAPDELEKKIAAKSALDSLFAANRKAKLWDQFMALYGGIATEAEDDFHNLFGKAFLQAYEEQMERLRSGQ